MDDRQFGEEGARLSYGSYLRLGALLDQQRPQSAASGDSGSPSVGVPRRVRAAHDELLFITVHQVYELWFQLLLHELGDARDRMLAGEDYLPRLRRAHVVERILVEQVDVIETMTPQDFLTFRETLAPAAASSPCSSGRSSSCPEPRIRPTSPVSAMPTRPSWPGCGVGSTSRRCGTASWRCWRPPTARWPTLLQVSRDRAAHGGLWDLAEALIDHDEMWARWRPGTSSWSSDR